MNDESIINRVNPLSDKILIGMPLGKFRIKIRAAGQKFHTELEGELYDATDRFINTSLVTQFKQIVCDDIKAIKGVFDTSPIYEETPSNPVDSDTEPEVTAIATQPEKPEKLLETVKAFRAFPLGKVCRVLILDEEGTRYNHIILQFGRLNLLTDYATIPDKLGRTVLHGQKVTFQASGWGMSLPQRRELPDGLGKGFIHWFIPDDQAKDSAIAVENTKGAAVLCEIVPFLRQTVNLGEYKRAKENQIKAKDDAIKEIGNELKAQSVETDLMHKVFSLFKRHDKGTANPIKQHDFWDFIGYAVPWAGFSLVGLGLASGSGSEVTGVLFGGILGLIVGAGFNLKRK